jgi:hypothetical protein
MLQPVSDHLVHEIVGDKRALIYERFGCFTELSPLRDIGAKNVASRDLRDAIGSHQSLRLRPFAHAGRT